MDSAQVRLFSVWLEEFFIAIAVLAMDTLLLFTFRLTQQLIHVIRPILVPFCSVLAWVTVVGGVWQVIAIMRGSFRRAQRMHQIPCAQCQYFSGNYLLKCPVHPQQALSEAAIGCPDFASTQMDWVIQQRNL